MRIARASLILAHFVALSAAAQTVSVGSLPPFTTTGFVRSTAATVIDFTHPASVAGTVRYAAVEWTGGSCASGVKVKFLRRAPGTFGTFTVTAERGPFDVTGGVNRFALTPGVDVSTGDLIAITQLTPSCGSVTAANVNTSDSVFVINSEVSGSSSFAAGAYFPGTIISAQATPDGDVTSLIVPVVGATSGGFGAQFRTTFQLTNPTGQTIQGNLVLHPINAGATAGDPTVPYSLSARKTVSLDFLADVKQSGVFSMDVVPSYSAPPVVSTRVFNDSGADGTSGFSEDALRPEDALVVSQSTLIPVPADLTNYRMNIGLRSLRNGATITVTLSQPSGATIGTLTKSYDPNRLEQTSLQSFLGSLAPVPGGSINIKVSSGSAFIYSTVTDNRTNDSALQYAVKK